LIAVRHPARRLLAATAILVALVAVVGVSVYAIRADRPMSLMAVCTGAGTQTVRCTWIPADEGRRTAAEIELATASEE